MSIQPTNAMASGKLWDDDSPRQHQAYAFHLVYDRLPLLIFVPIVTVAVIPFVFLILNTITGGHAHLFTLLFGAMYGARDAAIRRYAVDANEIAKAQARTRAAFPFIAALISLALSYLIRYFTGDYLAWFPSLVSVFGLFGRIAVAVCVLEFAVLLRYFGPLSIMRCSSVPLVSNFSWSPLDILVMPHDALTRMQEQRTGRRYHFPTALTTVRLFIVLALLGSALFIARPLSVKGPAALAACSLMILLAPLWKYVGQTNHEIDPRPHSVDASIWFIRMIQRTLKESVISTALFLGVSLLLEFFFSYESVLNLYSGTMISIITFLCIWGQNVWEESLLLALFHPRRDATRDILEMVDFSHAACVRVLLAFLLSDPNLVEDVLSTPFSFITEVERVKELSQRHGRQLLEPLPHYVEAPLEEDVVRLGILEAFGSNDDSDNRQIKIVESWLNATPSLMHGGINQELPCVPLLRALCVSVGGMGDALRYITDTKQVKWDMSIGGLLSLAYSIIALQRFLFASPGLSQRTVHQMKSFAPAALLSLHKLYEGTKTYRQMHRQNSDVDLVNAIMRDCEVAAAHISTRFDVGLFASAPRALDRRVLEWVEKSKDLLPH